MSCVDRIKFQTFDADSGTPVDSTVTALQSEDDSVSDSGSETLIDLPDGADCDLSVLITASDQAHYRSRSLTFNLQSLSKSRPVYYLFLATQPSGDFKPDLAEIKKSAAYLPNQVDRAVVLLERIADVMPNRAQPTQADIRLAYSLADAYYQNCTKRFIDSCKDAMNYYKTLKYWQSDFGFYFDMERIALTDIWEVGPAMHKINLLYDLFLKNVETRKFSSALLNLNEIEKTLREDKTIRQRFAGLVSQIPGDRALILTLMGHQSDDTKQALTLRTTATTIANY